MLAEVAGSSLAPRHVVNPLRRLCPEVTVLRGAIGSIDLPGRSFTVEPGDFTSNLTIRFEHLVPPSVYAPGLRLGLGPSGLWR
jgi:NADH dehydrogenase